VKKIPLEDTIVETYKFLFQNFLSIIGTLWLPFVLFIAVIAALLASLIPHAWLAGDFTPVADPDGFFRAHIPQLMLALPVVYLTLFLVSAMIRVGILRHALGQKTTTTWVYFSLGSRIWRMVGAMLLMAVVYVGLVLAVVIAVGASGIVMHLVHASALVTGLVAALLIIAGIVWAIYTLLRMFFFLPAIIVDQDRIAVGKSWELGRGNVWRMIVVMIAVVVPAVMIGEIGIYTTVLSTIAGTGIAHQGAPTPEMFAAILKSLVPVLPILICIYLAMIIAIVGLSLGAVGKAYKAVTAEDAG
jgi:hypothetical protein